MDLKVRNLDAAVGVKLQEFASKKRIGVETLARKILSDFALAPEFKYTEEKYSSLMREMIGLYESTVDECNECIRDNTYLIKQMLDLLNEMNGVEDE